MATRPEGRHFTFEEYLLLLRGSNQRLEFDRGEIYAMAGSSANHAAILFNMCRALDDALGADSPCRAYVADRVVKLQENLTVMPDVVVTCDQADQGDAFLLEAPRLVVEVLSKSTQARDRTYKLLLYQARQTIDAIIFISQRVQHIEVITRTDTGWDYHEYGAGEACILIHLNITIQVADIYRRLAIPAETRRIIPIEVHNPDDDEPDDDL
jgi:Uma2 family endonuclease